MLYLVRDSVPGDVTKPTLSPCIALQELKEKDPKPKSGKANAGSKLVVPNIEALMSEMERIGYGLVRSIQINRDPTASD